jgi:quinol monooxygenase YgiN
MMLTVGLLVRLEARSGKEKALAAFLRDGLPLAEAEPATVVWFGFQLGPSTFGIFDAFADENGRAAHLAGQIAAALGARGGELLAGPPTIQRIDVLGAKLPSTPR